MSDDDADIIDAGSEDVVARRVDAITNLLPVADACKDNKLRTAALKTIELVQMSIQNMKKQTASVTYLGKPAERGPFSGTTEGSEK